MKQYVYLLILPIMFLISCSDDTVEEMGGSNHVLLERYPQEVINISMDNPESFASFNKTSVTRSSELLKDSVWSSGNGPVSYTHLLRRQRRLLPDILLQHRKWTH